MKKLEHHVFVCINDRTADDPRGACTARGGKEVHKALKAAVKEAGLKGRVRVNKAGCLDVCSAGPVVVVYPEGVWYGPVSPEDVPDIVQDHLLDGTPVPRIRRKDAGPDRDA